MKWWIIIGYYDVFRKSLLSDVLNLQIKITPPFFKRIFNNKKAHYLTCHFDLIRAYRFYHVIYIPLFWKRKFYLYNKKSNIFCEIDKRLEKELGKCKDDLEEYNPVLKKFLKRKKLSKK